MPARLCQSNARSRASHRQSARIGELAVQETDGEGRSIRPKRRLQYPSDRKGPFGFPDSGKDASRRPNQPNQLRQWQFSCFVRISGLRRAKFLAVDGGSGSLQDLVALGGEIEEEDDDRRKDRREREHDEEPFERDR